MQKKQEFVTSRLKTRWCFMRLSFWTTWGHQMWYVKFLKVSKVVSTFFKTYFQSTSQNLPIGHIVRK
jgi:hypothetical protein